MVSKELKKFIRLELRQAKSKEDIRRILLAEGWKEQDIAEAFAGNMSRPAWLRLLTNKYALIAIAGVIVFFSLLGTAVLSSRVGNTQLTPVPQILTTPGSSATKVPTATLLLTPTHFQHLLIPTVTGTVTGTQAQSVGDCGTEIYTPLATTNPTPAYPRLQCFISAAITCTPTTLQMITSVSVMGLQQKTPLRYTLDKQGTGCNLIIQNGKTEFTLPEGLPVEQVQPFLEIYQKMDNTNGVCYFADNNDLANFFRKFADGSYVSSALNGNTQPVYVNGSCSGTYFDAAKEIESSVNK